MARSSAPLDESTVCSTASF